jgi:phage terminase large subunit-like protein
VATAEAAFFTGHGDRVAKFVHQFVRQTKGRWAGVPLTLEPWQKEVLDELYLVDSDGNFVYREALIGIPRKNGKSTLMSAIALYGLLASGEQGAEVYAAAASKDQARIVFDQARQFVEA